MLSGQKDPSSGVAMPLTTASKHSKISTCRLRKASCLRRSVLQSYLVCSRAGSLGQSRPKGLPGCSSQAWQKHRCNLLTALNVAHAKPPNAGVSLPQQSVMPNVMSTAPFLASPDYEPWKVPASVCSGLRLNVQFSCLL